MGLIYLDAPVVIYLVERHGRWGEPAARAIAGAPEARFGVSALAKAECLAAPLKRGDPVLRRAYLDLFDLLLPLAMPETAYLEAAELRARFGLSMPDALHLACAHHHGCEALWTNHDRLEAASHGLARNILKAQKP
ncbi:MAG: PIN domain-containing protein [Caulobacteraceae bacterium]|nr:PIN domain-containing protein [Caulobacteraceae bacterium]